MGILDIRNDAVYFDGSNTTNRILDVLEEERRRIICIDELGYNIPRTIISTTYYDVFPKDTLHSSPTILFLSIAKLVNVS
jgi:hypothetical protein